MFSLTKMMGLRATNKYLHDRYGDLDTRYCSTPPAGFWSLSADLGLAVFDSSCTWYHPNDPNDPRAFQPLILHLLTICIRYINRVFEYSECHSNSSAFCFNEDLLWSWNLRHGSATVAMLRDYIQATSPQQKEAVQEKFANLVWSEYHLDQDETHRPNSVFKPATSLRSMLGMKASQGDRIDEDAFFG
jgi:hypothetical protein